MSLESLLKPAKWLDRKVQKQFTRLGQTISENDLYAVTTGFQMMGQLAIAISCIGWKAIQRVDVGYPVAFFGIFNLPDFLYNLDGLKGKILKETDGNIMAIDSQQEFYINYNKKIRLPVFLASVGFLGKAAYDVTNYFINGELIPQTTVSSAATGWGLLGCAASMYLKDQDPKLLKKSPSKVRAFLKNVYENAKDLISVPKPALQPMPVKVHYSGNYSGIEDYVLNNADNESIAGEAK